MAVHSESMDQMPVVSDRRLFDAASGNALERLIFNNRLVVLVLCALASVVFGYHALRLDINASYDKMLPQTHPYMLNYFEHRRDLGTLGNTVRIVVENKRGSIFDAHYLEVLRQATDAIMITDGVFRGAVKSLWLPSVRWTDIVAEGYIGGPVMPDHFDGSAASMRQLQLNVQRAHVIGTLVSPDLRSSMIVVPLVDLDPTTGKPLDYHRLSSALEQTIRSLGDESVEIHIVGFAKLVGDLIDGLQKVTTFFILAIGIAAVVIFGYSRCLRSTLLLIVTSLLGVVWLLGLIQLSGMVLDPYSMLVPFLIFAIGVSHGAQKMNGIARDVALGTHPYVAARYTFRRLFLPGLTALLTNVVGFAVLIVVEIPVIREMAMIMSAGVTVLIFTKLILIPVALSYIGVSKTAARRRLQIEEREQGGQAGIMRLFMHFTDTPWAIVALLVAGGVTVTSLYLGRELQVGDIDPGAPELWPDSRYNRDEAFVNDNFGLSSDQFAIIVQTGPEGGLEYDNLIEMERFGWLLKQQPGVQGVASIAEKVPYVTMGQFEGNPKWMTIHRSANAAVAVNQIWTAEGLELVNADYSVMPVIAYLTDHKAQTLSRMLAVTEGFARQHDSDAIKFLPVAGSAGIQAVTNIVVEKAHYEMLALVYASVIVLCYITFRSWMAVIVALIPLLITSIVCEALMAQLGIGLKVATLPVHALGVGVGVDYALYLLSIQLHQQRNGATLAQAYGSALAFTGKIVALIGITMAAGVITWAWSPIKFQADMGILLAFMFVWNMIGALIMIPALSRFLLTSAPVAERVAAHARAPAPAQEL